MKMKPQYTRSNNIFQLYVIILLRNPLSNKSCPKKQLSHIEQGDVAFDLRIYVTIAIQRF